MGHDVGQRYDPPYAICLLAHKILLEDSLPPITHHTLVPIHTLSFPIQREPLRLYWPVCIPHLRPNSPFLTEN